MTDRKLNLSSLNKIEMRYYFSDTRTYFEYDNFHQKFRLN